MSEDGTSDVSVEEQRKYLGRFGLTGELQLNKIKVISGGQKSRLQFSTLQYKKPHILLMDEPTNHLDLETIESLAYQLNNFEGGVVLVSHDERLLSLVCDELWVVTPGQHPEGVSVPYGTPKPPGNVTVFDGSFDQYRIMLRDDMLSKKLLKGGGGRIKCG